MQPGDANLWTSDAQMPGASRPGDHILYSGP